MSSEKWEYYNKTRTILTHPEDFEHLGVSRSTVSNILIKLIDKNTRIDGAGISSHLKIPFPNIIEDILNELRERLLVDRTGIVGGEMKSGKELVWRLSEEGKKLAGEIKNTSLYCNAIPVSLDTYNDLFESYRFTRSIDMDLTKEILSDLVLCEETLIQIGVALNRKGSIFIYGPPGNGKTSIAKRMIGAVSDNIIIPYAVETGGDVICIHDPSYHHPAGGKEFLEPFRKKYGDGYRYDRRWVPVKTPMITAATELRVADLDLTYNPISKYYEAPLHMKANGGMLLIDDLGRQREPADAFLNRWIHPLEDGYDFLTLATGRQIKVQFNAIIVYSTNLKPELIGDKAFLRRFRSRIYIQGPTREEFEEISRRICKKNNIEFKKEYIGKLIDGLFSNNENLCGCHPRDAMMSILSRAKFLGLPAELNDETIAYAVSQVNYLN